MSRNLSSSTKRVYSQFKDISIENIALVQSAYSNNNLDLIRRVLNKPTQSESYIKALGRLSNQYITIMNQPSYAQKRTINSVYNIQLTDDYHENLLLSGNSLEQEPIDYVPPNVERILEVGGILGVNRQGNYETRIDNINVNEFLDNFQRIDDNLIPIRDEYGVNYCRVFMKCSTESGNDVWVSTPILPIGVSFRNVQDFIDDFVEIIDETIDYNYQNTSIEHLESIEYIRIQYYE